MKKKNKPVRIDEGLHKDLKDIMRIRAKSGLADPMKREEISMREATRLARTTHSWKGVLNELKWKKKRKK